MVTIKQLHLPGIEVEYLGSRLSVMPSEALLLMGVPLIPFALSMSVAFSSPKISTTILQEIRIKDFWGKYMDAFAYISLSNI